MMIWHIDDDDIQLELVGLKLKKVNHEATIIAFQEGAVALERLAKFPAPDLLLLDLNMPGLSGWDVLEHMIQRSLAIPTWILTSSIDPRDSARATSYSFVRGLLVKPLSLDQARAIFARGR